MTFPQNNRSHDQHEAPELERETLKDLTPLTDQAEGVKGGDTGDGNDCKCTTM